MIYNILMVDPELAGKKHYFLESLDNLAAVWIIRGICLIAGVVALVLYYWAKKKRGE